MSFGRLFMSSPPPPPTTWDLARQQAVRQPSMSDHQRLMELYQAMLAQHGQSVYGAAEEARDKEFAALKTETAFGELTGWRAWGVIETPEGLRLKSTYKDTIWPSSLATSETGAKNSADVFKKRHEAGYYAFKRPFQLFEQCSESGVFVGGKVEMWGAVAEHEKGYRAENMRIITLEPLVQKANLIIDELRDFYLKGDGIGYRPTDPEADGGSPEEPRPLNGSDA